MSISQLVPVPNVYNVYFVRDDKLLPTTVMLAPSKTATIGYIQTWLDENIPGAKVCGTVDQLMAFEIR